MPINPIIYARTKHIQVDYQFVQDKVGIGFLIICYLPSSKQVIDVFMKTLDKEAFKDFFYLK